MNTTPPDDWLALAQRQQARAMAGDQRAAAWCARHAPALDAARGWQAYNDLWDKFQRLSRAYDRLHLHWRGTDKLQTGRWKEGGPEYQAWAEELRQSWTSPEAKADLDAIAAGMDKWTPEQWADFQDSLSEFLSVVAETHGLDIRKLQSIEQAQRLLDSYVAGTFEQTCRELAVLTAGQEQGATHGD